MPRKKRTPWQKIRDAADNGTGLRLTCEEVERLGYDGAIMSRADRDDHNDRERRGAGYSGFMNDREVWD